ncbi:MAG: DUF2834 domain-containing protein [Pseudomonadota bacterium]|nr:DUF2834 domain-containing protein [Pseudomonadota bacterium]
MEIANRLLNTALPLSQFLPWVGEHGLILPLMLQQIQADRLSAFAWADVLVSGVAVIAFVLVESHRIDMRHGWLALLGLCVGVSLALPLFLLLRERHLQPKVLT